MDVKRKEKLKAKYGPTSNNYQYARWVLTISNKDIPKDVFPYVSEAPEGRKFSDGDLLFWYLTKRMPLALNGDTGVGKSTSVTYFANRKKVHLEETIPKPIDSVDNYLAKEIQDSKTGRVVFSPLGLVLANVYKGMFFLDEAAIMDGNCFTEFNKIFQGLSHSFMTQFGQVKLDWKEVHPIIGGNFHDHNPDFYPSSRYRFVWKEFVTPSDEQLNKLSLQRLRQREGKSVDFGKLKQPIEYDPNFPKSSEYLKTINDFSQELYSTLLAFSHLNRGITSDRSGGSQQGRISQLIDFYHSLRNSALESENGSDIGSRMREAKTYLTGRRLKSAPAVPVSTVDRASALFHPKMTPLDYMAVLQDVYVNPATAVASIPFNEAMTAYSSGMEKIIEDKVQKWFDVLQKKVR